MTNKSSLPLRAILQASSFNLRPSATVHLRNSPATSLHVAFYVNYCGTAVVGRQVHIATTIHHYFLYIYSHLHWNSQSGEKEWRRMWTAVHFVAAKICLANGILAINSHLVVLWHVSLCLALGICHSNPFVRFPGPAREFWPYRSLLGMYLRR